MKTNILKTTLALCLLSAVACNKNNHTEEELITTVKLKITNTATSASSEYTFADSDGAGGNNPTKMDSIKLLANTNYTCAIQVWNESVNPAEDITPEVVKEANDHQFYYVPNGVNATISNLNVDSKSLALGTTFNLGTGTASNGRLQVILKHKPGVKSASDNSTVGDTDIELPNGGFYTEVK